MPLTLEVQFQTVLYSILSGILIGVLFDLYSMVRGIKVPKIIVIIEDILFWVLTAITVFTFLLYKNYAFLGPYVYVFMILTLIIYLKIISSKVRKIEMYIIEKVSWLFRITFKTLSYPLKIVYYNILGKK
ncbi:spore cortex biosynthesis protein YabQ [Clostridium isatidis]|uniref:Spore cortex biosynthesis protein YabQ n=1 Tax=Clostridium isatidis TaxID=182773 RepID=A0A343J984_9CLOT|nr:spore cortex biosynthesis protein YabQ [Clostridium isatidis]ASW42092.1 spore cortex biosynthesis protein YabQ [Clostridium isatidis]NLZ34306.1 spore cortex biosynthesis protein YabQ [Clostridiales bacterium]